MSEMYAMQRANGDWFALDDNGRMRVPVFRSTIEAMDARVRNPGMMLFKPVVLDESALHDIAPAKTEDVAGFWLVSDSSVSLRRGRPMEYSQVILLVRETVAQPTG